MSVMFGGGIAKAEQKSRSSLLEGTISRSGSLQGPPVKSTISGIAAVNIFHNICEGRKFKIIPPNNPLPSDNLSSIDLHCTVRVTLMAMSPRTHM